MVKAPSIACCPTPSPAASTLEVYKLLSIGRHVGYILSGSVLLVVVWGIFSVGAFYWSAESTGADRRAGRPLAIHLNIPPMYAFEASLEGEVGMRNAVDGV
jgi:hypothetical protein